MAARAFTRIPRASPNLFPSRVVHRCILPVAGKLNAGIVSDEGRREKLEKRQIGGSADGRPNALMSQARNIHMTRRSENTVIMAGLGIAASAMAARYGLQAYNNWKSGGPQAAAKEEPAADGSKVEAEGNSAEGAHTASSSAFFGSFGKKHYEGGFDDKMTRREAALILGVRESAAPQRIKDAHRRILMINHPDKGGSKYMAAKINEAKEILLKGRT